MKIWPCITCGARNMTEAADKCRGGWCCSADDQRMADEENKNAKFMSLSTAQCSSRTNQSRPFPARSVKIMESAGQIPKEANAAHGAKVEN